ncbi:MAG TPA: DinB family protein [Rubricoccaceae bacterium]
MAALALLRDDLARAYDGDAWHGDPLLSVLGGIDALKAAARPVPGAHSVWEVVLHLAAWMEIGTRRVVARAPVPMDPSDDWPPVPEPADAAAWAETLGRLSEAQRALLEAVDGLGESDVWAPLGPRDRSQGTGGTVASLLTGLAQHAAYHGGQIALLRRALGAG